MCNLMQCIPTNPDEYPIYQGGSISLGAIFGVGPFNGDYTGGEGTITTLNSNNFVANGTYSFTNPITGTNYQGTWNINFSNLSDGWSLSITSVAQNGTPSLSDVSVSNLSCSQSGSGTGTELTFTGTYNGNDISIVQHYHEDLFLGPQAKTWWTGLPVDITGFESVYIEGVVKKPNQEKDYSKNPRITGRVVDPNGRPVSGLRVEAWDKDRITKDDFLGRDFSHEDGSFKMLIDDADHKEWIFDRNPDVYFKIYNQRELIYTTEKEPIWNMKDTQYKEIQLPMRPFVEKNDALVQMNGIYGGKVLDKQEYVDNVKQSGYNNYIFWALHVETNGDLKHYGSTPPTICKDGAYTGPPEWKHRLASLISKPTSVKIVSFSVGGYGSQDYHNIENLINEHGTGPNSILYKNFKALKDALPEIAIIDFDNEDNLSGPGAVSTMVKFASMLYELGYLITFCPYDNHEVWVECLKTLNSGSHNIVVGFNLQCYAGGQGNANKDALQNTWIDPIKSAMNWSQAEAAAFVRPGLQCVQGPDCTPNSSNLCPSQVKIELASWKPLGLRGGWIWKYGNIVTCQDKHGCTGESTDSATYSKAIKQGLDQGVETKERV